MMDLTLPDDTASALRLASDRDAWPTMPNCYGGRSPLPVAIRLGADVELWFTPDSFRWALLIARRICAAGGPEAVVADAPPDGLVESYRERCGEWAACYEVEQWYARLAGPRRRIVAALCPSRGECEAEFPPREWEPVVAERWAKVEQLAWF